jgi:hypothetical protein
MWTRVASFALFIAGGVAQVQSADESASGLDSCFQAAGAADAICSKLSDDPEQRLDCFARARAVQLECLDRILSEGPVAGPKAPRSASDAAPSVPPAEMPPTQARSEGNTPKEPAPSDTIGSIADEAAERPDASPKSAPVSHLPSVAIAPSGPMRPDTSGSRDDRTAGEPDWILSETTSPVDFGPLVVAVIHSKSGAKDGENVLSVRCRSRHTEVSLRMNGAWTPQRGNKLQVEYQINDQPMIRQQWTLSADAKTATYRGDSVELLQSIPEGAALKVAVADGAKIRREATFQLTGLSAVRQKVAAACNWMPLTAKTSSEQR